MLFLSLLYAVFIVQLVHAAGVKPDDQDVDDQRTLGAHVEGEGKTHDDDVIELGGEKNDDKSRHEPYRKQDRGEPQILAPVLLMSFRQFHGSSSVNMSGGRALLIDVARARSVRACYSADKRISRR